VVVMLLLLLLLKSPGPAPAWAEGANTRKIVIMIGPNWGPESQNHGARKGIVGAGGIHDWKNCLNMSFGSLVEKRRAPPMSAPSAAPPPPPPPKPALRPSSPYWSKTFRFSANVSEWRTAIKYKHYADLCGNRGDTWIGKAIISLSYFFESSLGRLFAIRIFIGVPLESLQIVNISKKCARAHMSVFERPAPAFCTLSWCPYRCIHGRRPKFCKSLCPWFDIVYIILIMQGSWIGI